MGAVGRNRRAGEWGKVEDDEVRRGSFVSYGNVEF